jgi:hypothetical protein
MRSGRATVFAWNPAHDTDYGRGDNEKLPDAREICSKTWLPDWTSIVPMNPSEPKRKSCGRPVSG